MITVNVDCSDVRYSEFPELLCGKNNDGQWYFDMTKYIESKGSDCSKSVLGFQKFYSQQVCEANKHYQINPDKAIVENQKDGHHLIAVELGLLFLMYMESGFLTYVLDRADEMLVSGMTLSDTALHTLHNSRFQNTLPISS